MDRMQPGLSGVPDAPDEIIDEQALRAQWKKIDIDERLDEYVDRVLLGNEPIKPEDVTPHQPHQTRGTLYETDHQFTTSELISFVRYYFEQAGYRPVKLIETRGDNVVYFDGERDADGVTEEVRGEIRIIARDQNRPAGLDVSFYNEGPDLFDRGDSTSEAA